MTLRLDRVAVVSLSLDDGYYDSEDDVVELVRAAVERALEDPPLVELLAAKGVRPGSILVL